jgi:hypothetical protein
MNRRETMRLLAAASLLPRTALAMISNAPSRPRSSSSARVESQSHTDKSQISAADDAFLDDMQRRACLYFTEQSSPTTGQVLDRSIAASTGTLDHRHMASIAATGFGLSALCIADKRGYFPHTQILEQVRRTLRFHAETLPNVHGFFYHFNDVNTGTRFGHCELSPIDTSLLLCGVLTARAHFSTDPEIPRLAALIYNRVDWPWMLNNGHAFAMGWSPEHGFQPGRWSHYCELMMLYLLALGSPTHPVSPATWDAFTRPTITYDNFTYISSSDPLFVHQYSHAWFDFRYKRDKYADYFANSILATRAHKAFCLDLGQPYSPDYWGISASDSAHGYTAWGGPSAAPHALPADHPIANPPFNPIALARSFGGVDGSVVPYAAAGSLPFLPADCLRVLRSLKGTYPQTYGRYGFCDAFHPSANYYDPDVLGIDLGIGLLMSENLRSSFVWDTFSRNPEVAMAFRQAGFRYT